MDKHVAIARLQEIAALYQTADAGPSAVELSEAPLMGDWQFVLYPGGSVCLSGHAANHPGLPDQPIVSSRVFGFDAARTWARTGNRWYALRDQVFSDQLAPPKAIRFQGIDLEFQPDDGVVALSDDQAAEAIARHRRQVERALAQFLTAT